MEHLFAKPLLEARLRFEAAYLRQAMRDYCGNVNLAARDRVGTSASCLFHKLKEFGINPDDYRRRNLPRTRPAPAPAPPRRRRSDFGRVAAARAAIREIGADHAA